ncbi:hypothetical protein [[Clostridium] polysaccharolyticum]|uniref:Lipoprotein n=1 Tax=[Clostridium] polysaccharolyticum TaxID=29364 RepID=A0A1H9YBM1_9FIRM|nr:hypothetical protein [[Clostridium] polysaccharolyticum]SES65817.1 hypothetical protein SAMN04487772_101250 [[Clostridium] polysaccharolyticum]
MKKRIYLVMFLAVCVSSAVLNGCHKHGSDTKEKTGESGKTVKTTASLDIAVTEDPQVPAVDIDALDGLKGEPVSAQNKAHNLYRGMIKDEEVILDLWIDKEKKEAQTAFVGAFHSEELSFLCELLEDGVRFHNDQYYFLLKQQKDDVLKGYFYEAESEIKEVELTLEAINDTEDKEHLYTIGENDEVEAFAQKVLDSINGFDFKTFSSYVSFPIKVRVNQAIQTIKTKEGFKALGGEVIFTDGFVSSMAAAYPNLMPGNETDGVMLGDGQYNVWIQLDDNGQMKVAAIHN